MEAMALIEIDGLPFLIAWWIFPWQTVNVITRWYQGLLHQASLDPWRRNPGSLADLHQNRALVKSPIFEGPFWQWFSNSFEQTKKKCGANGMDRNGMCSPQQTWGNRWETTSKPVIQLLSSHRIMDQWWTVIDQWITFSGPISSGQPRQEMLRRCRINQSNQSNEIVFWGALFS